MSSPEPGEERPSLGEPTRRTEPQSDEAAPPGALGSTHARVYWRRNVLLLSTLLAIWFVVSFGLGILLVRPLNEVRMGGFPLGFWFAHQGSIYAFIVLIFVYARSMDRTEARMRRDLDR